MKVKKFFGYGENSPFKSQLFNIHTNYLLGRSGLLDEIKIDSKDSKIKISNLVFVSKGIIIVLEEEVERTIPEKYFNKPCVLVANVSDNTEKSKIVFDFINSDDDLQNRTIIARYDGVEWFSEQIVSSSGIINKFEDILKSFPISFQNGLDISRNESKLILSAGFFINKEGKLVHFKKNREFELPKIDSLFPNRMDIILYKKNFGLTATGTFELISGPTLSGLPNEKKSGKTTTYYNGKYSFFNYSFLTNDIKIISRIGFFKDTSTSRNLTAVYLDASNNVYFNVKHNALNPFFSTQVSNNEIDFVSLDSKKINFTRYRYSNNNYEKIKDSVNVANHNGEILYTLLEKDRFNNNYIISEISNKFKREMYLHILSENLTNRLNIFKLFENVFDIKFKVDSQLKIHIAYSSNEGIKYKVYSFFNNEIILEKDLLFSSNSSIFGIKLMSDDTAIVSFYNDSKLNIYLSTEEKPRKIDISFKIITIDFEINDLGWIHFVSIDINNNLRQFDYSISQNKIELTFFEKKLENCIFGIKILKEKLGSLSIFYSSYNLKNLNSIDLKSSYIGENIFDGIKSQPWQVLISKSEFSSKNILPISGDFLDFGNNNFRQIVKTDVITVNASEHYIFDLDSFISLESSQNKNISLIKHYDVLSSLVEEKLPGLASCSVKDFIENELNCNIIHSVIERQNNTILKRSTLKDSRVGNGYFFKYAFNKDSSDSNSEANQTNFSDAGIVLPSNGCTKAVSIPTEIVGKRNINVILEILDPESLLPKDSFHTFPKIVLDNITYGMGWEYNGSNSILITFYEKPNFISTWSELKNKGIKYRVLFTENKE